MSYAWLTDIHLDHLGDDNQRLIKFAESVIRNNPTGLLITGDISTSKRLIFHLSALERVVQRPIYFICGNHDYYFAPIEPVRKALHELSNSSQYIKYLSTTSYVSLTPATGLVGSDGWYDAGYGNWQNSSFQMTDWDAIHDFRNVNGAKSTIVALARKLAHESTLHIQEGIKKATRYHKSILILTHVPPFTQAHVYNGRPGEMSITPWYTNSMMGSMLMDASKAYPNVKFTVLCGHTHGRTSFQAAPNLVVQVGGAEYGKPELQGLVDVA